MNRNNLVDNGGFGINNLAPTAAIDATGNWWGDADGPGGQGPGAGDGVNGNVDFTGWTPKIIALAVLASPDSAEVPGGDSVQVHLYLQSWDQPNDVVHVDVSDPLGWLEGPASFDVVLDSGDATVIAQFTAPVGTPGGMTNDVTITGVSQSDPDQTGDASLAITSAPSADLSVFKEDDADPVIFGTQVTHSITVSNSGPDQATGIIVLDTLPDTVEFVSASNGDATCLAGDGVVICQIAHLSSGGQSTIDIVVTTREIGDIVNAVTVNGNEHDPNMGGNSDAETTSVQRLSADEFPGSVIQNLPFDATVDTSTAGLDPGEPSLRAPASGPPCGTATPPRRLSHCRPTPSAATSTRCWLCTRERRSDPLRKSTATMMPRVASRSSRSPQSRAAPTISKSADGVGRQESSGSISRATSLPPTTGSQVP